jgi:hypothetical protein
MTTNEAKINDSVNFTELKVMMKETEAIVTVVLCITSEWAFPHHSQETKWLLQLRKKLIQ